MAMLLFWGIFALGVFLSWRDPEFAYKVAGKDFVDQVDDNFSEELDGRSSDASAVMGGFYAKHNPTIGLRCFAFGMLLGVGGLFETAMNAAVIGTLFGYMIQSPNHTHFFHFVTAHSSFELTGVVLMAAAGMRLGFSMIDTGGRTRSDSLRRAASQIVPIMSVGVIFFLTAAPIEAFISPSALPYPVKAGVAIVSALMIFFYIAMLGYAGSKTTMAPADKYRIPSESFPTEQPEGALVDAG
jgi:uncharacterized membrane protein SpoIIM required for sporulation